MSVHEATPHPNLKALGITLALIACPAAVMGLGFLVATYSLVIGVIIVGALLFAGLFGLVRLTQNVQMHLSPMPVLLVLMASACFYVGVAISQA
jgi:ABC-type Na+ efflux pump permease subunit